MIDLRHHEPSLSTASSVLGECVLFKELPDALTTPPATPANLLAAWQHSFGNRLHIAPFKHLLWVRTDACTFLVSATVLLEGCCFKVDAPSSMAGLP